MMDGFLVGILFMLFVLFVLVVFGVIFAAAVCFLDIGKSESKPPFDPYITDDEQNLFVSRFSSFSFDEMPHFLYGIRNVPNRNVMMQFSHPCKCYINVSKDINKKGFKYEVKYKKTVIKTFDDWGDVGDYCWNLNISYRDDPDLVIKKLEIKKREALAKEDFE